MPQELTIRPTRAKYEPKMGAKDTKKTRQSTPLRHRGLSKRWPRFGFLVLCAARRGNQKGHLLLHLLKSILFILSPVGFKGYLSLLDKFLFLWGRNRTSGEARRGVDGAGAGGKLSFSRAGNALRASGMLGETHYSEASFWSFRREPLF